MSSIYQDIFDNLSRPFTIKDFTWHINAPEYKCSDIEIGIKVESLFQRLDEVLGANNWQLKYPHPNGYCVDLGLRFSSEWTWKSGWGSSPTSAIQQAAAVLGMCNRKPVFFMRNFPLKNGVLSLLDKENIMAMMMQEN